MNTKHVGSDFDEFLEEEGLLEEAEAVATKLLQSSGRASALRALLEAEQQRGPEFLRLANALSALYPKGSEERRLVGAMLQAVPR